MRFHLEGAPFYSHAIARLARPMAVARLCPWSDDAAGVWGTCDLPSQADAALKLWRGRENEFKSLHLGWVENLITDMQLADKFPAGPHTPQGPSFQDLGIGIMQNRLGAANVCAAIEPMAAELRDKNSTKLGLQYADMEFFPNAEGERYFPGMWAWLKALCPGDDDVQIEARVKTGVYTAIGNGLIACGMDRGSLVAWCCADRQVGWRDNDRASLALNCPVTRPHIAYTDGALQTLGRIRRELRAGSGVSRLVCHISSFNTPDWNQRVLTIMADEGVKDVIVYADISHPPQPTSSRAEEFALEQAAAIPRLDALLPVLAHFGATAGATA